MTGQISFHANWTALFINSRNQLRIVISTPLAIHCLNVQGDTLWSQPAVGISSHSVGEIKSDYLLAYQHRIKQDSVENFVLLNVNTGAILDQIRVPLAKNEHHTEILRKDEYYFIHFQKISNSILKKRFLILSVKNGGIRNLGEFPTCLWPAYPYVDRENHLLLFSNTSTCNTAYPIQGEFDCTGGIYLVSMDSWKILNRYLPLYHGYMSGKFVVNKNRLYLAFYSNIYNDIHYSELAVLEYPSFRIVRRKIFYNRLTDEQELWVKDDSVLFVSLVRKDGTIYLTDTHFRTVKTIPLPPVKLLKPAQHKRFELAAGYRMEVGDFWEDPEPELLVSINIWKKPDDPRGFIRDRYGYRSSYFRFYLFNSNFRLIGQHDEKKIGRGFGILYIPELNKFVFLTTNGIRFYQLQ